MIFNDHVNAALALFFMTIVIVVILACAREWIAVASGRKAPVVHEAPYIESRRALRDRPGVDAALQKGQAVERDRFGRWREIAPDGRGGRQFTQRKAEALDRHPTVVAESRDGREELLPRDMTGALARRDRSHTCAGA